MRRIRATKRAIALASVLAWSLLFACSLFPHNAAAAPRAGEPSTTELGNGLRVLVFPDSATPTVTATLWIGAGLVHSPRGREGLAELCAGAAEWRVRERMHAEAVGKAYLAGSLTSAVSTDHCFFSVTALETDLDAALEALHFVVLPGPEADGTDNPDTGNPGGALVYRSRNTPFLVASAWKRDAILNLVQTRFVPSPLAQDALSTLLFGDRRPLGFSGRFQTILGLFPLDVRAFHEQHYQPGNAILTIEGAIDSDRARGAAAARFADWKAVRPYEQPAWTRAAKTPARSGVTLIDDPDLTRAVILAGFSGPGREDAQGYAGMQLLQQVLGGKRMEEVVAEALGGQPGSYQFRTQLRASARGSELALEATVPHDVAPQALTELQRALGQLARSGIDAAGFRAELAAWATSLAFRFETPAGRAREAAARIFAGQKPAAAVAPPKPTALERAATTAQWRSLLAADRLVWVVVGRADDLSPKLTTAGIEHARTDPFQVVTGRLLAAGRDSVTQRSAAATVHAEEMILAAIEAKGGFEALERIESYTLEDSVMIQPGDRTIAGSRRLSVDFPDRYREDLEMSIFQGHSLVQVVNENETWHDQMGKVGVARGTRRRELLSRLWLDGLRVLHRYGEPGAIAFTVDPDVVGEVTLDGFQIVSPDGNWVRIYLHPASRLVAKRSFEKPGEDGATLALEELFTDYRPVQGVFVPFASITLLDGQFSSENHTDAININAEVEEGIFVRPE